MKKRINFTISDRDNEYLHKVMQRLQICKSEAISRIIEAHRSSKKNDVPKQGGI